MLPKGALLMPPNGVIRQSSHGMASPAHFACPSPAHGMVSPAHMAPSPAASARSGVSSPSFPLSPSARGATPANGPRFRRRLETNAPLVAPPGTPYNVATPARQRERAMTEAAVATPARQRERAVTAVAQAPSSPGKRDRAVTAAAQAHALAKPAYGADLRLSIRPGDVLCVRGNGALTQIGTSGGFMGHVLVVLGDPVHVSEGSAAQRELRKVWPRENDAQVWKVPACESARSRTGLHRSEVVLHVEPRSGRLVMIGELVAENEKQVQLGMVKSEVIELWQSPPPLRQHLRMDLMKEVLAEMANGCESWSLATAAQALFYRSAALQDDGVGHGELLETVQEAWEAPPICTSIVISFWQRYLCKLAPLVGKSEMELVLEVMPLRSDRGLPGELMSTMAGCGWVQLSHFPAEGRPQSAPGRN